MGEHRSYDIEFDSIEVLSLRSSLHSMARVGFHIHTQDGSFPINRLIFQTYATSTIDFSNESTNLIEPH